MRDRDGEVVVEMEVDDGVPQEIFGGETQQYKQDALYGLIEKTEGVAAAERAIATGTPQVGLPQVEESKPEIRLAAVPQEVTREPSRPIAPRSTRARDMFVGATMSAIALAAWYCLTQL